MSSDYTEWANIDAEEGRAFATRVMQISLLHRAGKGLDIVDGYRFRTVGFFEDVEPTPPPDALFQAFAAFTPSETSPTGPLFFVKAPDRLEYIEICTLFLHADVKIRTAVLEYCESIIVRREQCTSHTAELISRSRASVLSEDPLAWQAAGTILCDAIRADLVLSYCGLRQCLDQRYFEGVRDYLVRILNPRVEQLSTFRPPPLSTSAEFAEAAVWLLQLCKLASLETALDEYIARCGYRPLPGDVGAGSLVSRWLEQHPDYQLDWMTLQKWAAESSSPAIHFHMVDIALAIPRYIPPKCISDVWDRIQAILDEGGQSTSSIADQWHVLCEAATFFSYQVEALHPGQDGERLASCAWWLAGKLMEVISEANDSTRDFVRSAMESEFPLAYSRWAFARSPVRPSNFLYGTRVLRSEWARVLVEKLQTADLPAAPSIEQRAAISASIVGYALTSTLMDVGGDKSLSESTYPGWAKYLVPSDADVVPRIVEYKRRLTDGSELEAQLNQIATLSAAEQRVLVLFLRERVASGDDYDEIIRTWFMRADNMDRIMNVIPIELIGDCGEILLELQQRDERRATLPHVVAFAARNVQEAERYEQSLLTLFLLCVNAGVTSPLERLLSSSAGSKVEPLLNKWRHRALRIAKESEPWIACRVRSISAALSVHLGPPNCDMQDPARLDE